MYTVSSGVPTKSARRWVTLYVYLFGQDEFLELAEELLLPGGVLGPQGPPDQRQQDLPL